MKKEGGDHLVSLLERLVLPAGVLCATVGSLVPSTAGHTPHAFYRALPYLLPLVSASLALKGLLATKSQKS